MDINYTTRVNLRYNLIFVFVPTDKYSNILSKKNVLCNRQRPLQ